MSVHHSNLLLAVSEVLKPLHPHLHELHEKAHAEHVEKHGDESEVATVMAGTAIGQVIAGG